MLRNKLLNLLNIYQPTQEESGTKKQIIEFIKQNPNCFERSLEIGQITASAWLLNKDKSKVLLMHHNKFNMWVQLGGHCDGNPDVLEVALKEAQEESGIHNIVPISNNIFDIAIYTVPEYKNIKTHYHYDICFLLKVNSDEVFKKNSESKALKWIGKNIQELPTQEPSIVRMFNKWLKLEI